MKAFFSSLNPETLGIVFVLGLLALMYLSVKVILRLIKPGVNDIPVECENINAGMPEQSKPECVVLYELEHYSLKFLLIDGLWHSNIVTGGHESSITDIEPHALFRNIFMQVLLLLKVKKSNQKSI
jgi:hypothetical protein